MKKLNFSNDVSPEDVQKIDSPEAPQTYVRCLASAFSTVSAEPEGC